MDGRMNFRNWNFTEDTQPPHSNGNVNGFSSHLGLQLKSPIDEKPLFGGGGGGGSSNGVNGVNGEHHHVHPMSSMSGGGLFHHHRGISDSHHMAGNNYWMNPEREKYMHLLSGNRQHGFYQPAFGVAHEAASSAHPIQMTQQLTLPKSETMVPQVEEVLGEGETDNGLLPKKRAIEKLIKTTPKEKKPRTRVPRTPKDFPSSSENRARAPKKRAEVVINGVTMDITGIAIPVCSCTGTPQQCYRWGSGGWQSACCTTSLSMYPLPMSTKRRGARIAGRKMSIGAFTKVLEKLASEGYNFSNPIDLKCYWAKHGTNKFVTIR